MAPTGPRDSGPAGTLSTAGTDPLTGDIASRLPVDQDPTTETTDAQPCN
ncbi:hypothetical protein ACFONI_05140 [Aeromonas media]